MEEPISKKDLMKSIDGARSETYRDFNSSLPLIIVNSLIELLNKMQEKKISIKDMVEQLEKFRDTF